MDRYLLDVNCLVAIGWPNHVHHLRIRRWFGSTGHRSWATTPEIQSGFLRVSMNAKVTGTSASFVEALNVLTGLLAVGDHRLLANTVTPAEWPAWLRLRVQGHRQISDASLVACAQQEDCVLATLDEALVDLVDPAHDGLIYAVPL